MANPQTTTGNHVDKQSASRCEGKTFGRRSASRANENSWRGALKAIVIEGKRFMRTISDPKEKRKVLRFVIRSAPALRSLSRTLCGVATPVEGQACEASLHPSFDHLFHDVGQTLGKLLAKIGEFVQPSQFEGLQGGLRTSSKVIEKWL